MQMSKAAYRQSSRLNHLRGPSGRVVQGPGAIIVDKGPVLDLLAKGNKPKPQPSPMPDVIPLKGGTLADRMARMMGTKAAHNLGEFYMQTHNRRHA